MRVGEALSRPEPYYLAAFDLCLDLHDVFHKLVPVNLARAVLVNLHSHTNTPPRILVSAHLYVHILLPDAYTYTVTYVRIHTLFSVHL